MTTAEKRETLSDLRDKVEEINSDLDSAKDELADALKAVREIRQRIADLREDKAWRVEAIKFLKAGQQK
jgi:predicted  nucleic acid-binding Zn-ribbon protein